MWFSTSMLVAYCLCKMSAWPQCPPLVGPERLVFGLRMFCC